MRQLLTGRDGWQPFEELEQDGRRACRSDRADRLSARFADAGRWTGQAYPRRGVRPRQRQRNHQTRFANEMGQASFCQKDIPALRGSDMVHCCFCPLVDATWQKMALPQDRIELLCDIAMDGDRAILDLLGFSMELPCTLAHGDPTCTMHYSRDTQQY